MSEIAASPRTTPHRRRTSYARARLWLGITSVGTWVTLSTVLLVLGLAPLSAAATWGDHVVYLIKAIALYLAISLPFDLWGGWHLPTRFLRSDESLGSYLKKWSRGVAVQSLVVLVSMLILLAAGQALGLVGALLALAALSLSYLAGQHRLAKWVARFEERDAGSALYWKSGDPGFAGGWTGLPGRERLVIPESWPSELTSSEQRTQLVRRHGIVATGARARGVSLALGFQLVGFGLAALLPGAGVTTAPELLTTALGFTIWSFLGLLILPTPSRAGVYEADRYALDQGVDEAELIVSMRRLDAWQEDEPERAQGVELIFHPVPSVENRVRAIRESKRVQGAHHATRLALGMSWVCFGLLARAVHCNAGRPEVWVLYPSE